MRNRNDAGAGVIRFLFEEAPLPTCMVCMYCTAWGVKDPGRAECTT